MPDATSESLDSRLYALSARLVRRGLPPPTDIAIDLALALVIADRATPATTDVAALAPGTPLRDAKPLILDMLSEQDIPFAPEGSTEAEQWTVALWAFGRGGLPVSEFAQYFYSQLPAVGDQDETDQEIVVLLDEWQRQTSPERRLPLEAAMRAAARRGAARR